MLLKKNKPKLDFTWISSVGKTCNSKVNVSSQWIYSSTIFYKQDWKVRNSSIALHFSSNYYNPNRCCTQLKQHVDKPNIELIAMLTECSKRIYFFYLHKAKETIRWKPMVTIANNPKTLAKSKKNVTFHWSLGSFSISPTFNLVIMHKKKISYSHNWLILNLFKTLFAIWACF